MASKWIWSRASLRGSAELDGYRITDFDGKLIAHGESFDPAEWQSVKFPAPIDRADGSLHWPGRHRVRYTVLSFVPRMEVGQTIAPQLQKRATLIVVQACTADEAPSMTLMYLLAAVGG